jgi:hypothetical protein
LSRHHLRHDKTCLNCGALVEERYCTRCGQENLEPKETVGHLVRHFFEDITHFDGKFFVTLKDLIVKPGFLTREYVAGRRVAYLNPIRMYIFISAIFFIALFASTDEAVPQVEDHTYGVNLFRQQVADSLRSAKGDSLQRSFNGKMAVRLDSVKLAKDSSQDLNLNYGSAGMVKIDITENKYNTLHEYDSVQRTLPDTAKDQGMMHWILRNNVRQKEKHDGRNKVHIEVDVHHDIPKIMFLILPLFALYVSWFYSRKKYYYVNHAIFSVHFHCFIFLLFLFMLLLAKVLPGAWTPLILIAITPIPVFIYLVAALRGMYQQSFWLTLGKGVAIGLLYAITLGLASTLLMIITFIMA